MTARISSMSFIVVKGLGRLPRVDPDDGRQDHGPRDEKETRLLAKRPLERGVLLRERRVLLLEPGVDSRETQLHLVPKLGDISAMGIHECEQADEVVRSLDSERLSKSSLQVRCQGHWTGPGGDPVMVTLT